MRPMIGLTPTINDAYTQVLLNLDYQEAVRRSGALPVILPVTDDMDTLDALYERLDALVFTGGPDLVPALYGQETLPVCGQTKAIRDTMELPLLKRCLSDGKPFLAICRGFELFNVALGGTLYQDIATQRPGSLTHPCYDTPAAQVHTVTVHTDSRLYAISGMSELKVNSRHHQGVCTVGAGLKVTAEAGDGLVEGLELPEHPFALGIQWHPETLSPFAPEAQRIFDALCRAAAGGEHTC